MILGLLKRLFFVFSPLSLEITRPSGRYLLQEMEDFFFFLAGIMSLPYADKSGGGNLVLLLFTHRIAAAMQWLPPGYRRCKGARWTSERCAVTV